MPVRSTRCSLQNGFIGEARTEFERLSEAVTTSDIALAAVKEQFDAAQGRYLRLNADFENFRKRSATEKDAVVIKTKAGVIEVRSASTAWILSSL